MVLRIGKRDIRHMYVEPTCPDAKPYRDHMVITSTYIPSSLVCQDLLDVHCPHARTYLFSEFRYIGDVPTGARLQNRV